ncbi:unnamed protein product [Rhizopus stolonifer]
MNIDIDECVYTRCYCEENIYMLCKKVSEDFSYLIDQLTVVFISNDERKVPIWGQKSCRDDYPVIWDYHVILLFNNDNSLLLYDFDSVLPFPCPAEKYIMEAFKPQIVLRKDFERSFRLIPAKHFLHNFASDRSHMKGIDGTYLANPPKYDPIISKNDNTMNLDNYISMKEDLSSVDSFGKVFSSKEFFALAGIFYDE